VRQHRQRALRQFFHYAVQGRRGDEGALLQCRRNPCPSAVVVIFTYREAHPRALQDIPVPGSANYAAVQDLDYTFTLAEARIKLPTIPNFGQVCSKVTTYTNFDRAVNCVKGQPDCCPVADVAGVGGATWAAKPASISFPLNITRLPFVTKADFYHSIAGIGRFALTYNDGTTLVGG